MDLLARTPYAEENVPVKPPRVGTGAGIGLHGRETPEGFAVEEQPVRLPRTGTCTDGTLVETSILIPHPYAWLNLKVKAAHDWLQRMERGELERKPDSEKHVFDVYVLIAMLTETELKEATILTRRYASLPIAQEIRTCAESLYGSLEAPGVPIVRRQNRDAIDHSLFWEGLRTALGIEE